MVKRDVLIFRTYRLRFLGQALASFFTVAMTYYISRLVSVREFHTPDEYFAFAVVGLVIMQVDLLDRRSACRLRCARSSSPAPSRGASSRRSERPLPSFR